MNKYIRFFVGYDILRKVGRSYFMKRFIVWMRFYFRLYWRLRRQMILSSPAHCEDLYGGMKVLVPIIETSHYQHHHMLGVAKALQLRGASVKVLICDEFLDGCELKSFRNENDPDPCWTCRFNAKKMLPIYGLEVIKLSELNRNINYSKINDAAHRYVFEGEDLKLNNVLLNQAVQDSLVRYYYGAIPDDLRRVSKVRLAHAKTALTVATISQFIDDEWCPDIVFNNMSAYSAWDFLYQYFRKERNRFRQISLSQFDWACVTFNQFELFQGPKRFLAYKANRPKKHLQEFELKKLETFTGDRHAGRAPIFQALNFFKDENQVALVKMLNIDPKKRNIFLFSNIYWDVGLSEMSGLYPDVITWVLKTVELLKSKDNVRLYIKPHPGEVFDSSGSLKGVREIIAEKYPVMPSNITIIMPEWKVKTYDLFPHIDLGVIFTGTLGLEMMLSEIPVVSTGATTHFGLGFAAEPESEAKYLAYLLGNTKTPNYSKQELKLFAYFYFIRSKIPWPLTKQAFNDNFSGFTFQSLDEILPGKNACLDHLCNCIMNLDSTVAESWPDKLL